MPIRLALFVAAVSKVSPEFKGLVLVEQSEALDIIVSGPVGYLFALARERVRPFEPLGPSLPWSSEVRILVNPKQIDAPDIDVQRNGAMVTPSRTALTAQEMATRMGAKRMIHSGEVVYPLSAFEPGSGVTVTVIAIPASGSNLVRRFNSIELRRIQ